MIISERRQDGTHDVRIWTETGRTAFGVAYRVERLTVTSDELERLRRNVH